MMILCVGQEDLHGFHGKPVPENLKDEMIEELLKKISKSSATKLVPNTPVDDTKPTNLSNITLSSPPDYKIGQQVGLLLFAKFCDFINSIVIGTRRVISLLMSGGCVRNFLKCI